MYAILGMELFQGRIRMLGYPNATANVTELFCGDVKLKNSGFYKDHYCGENFNDILKSLKMLFDLMVVNQWHSILWFLSVLNGLLSVNSMILHVPKGQIAQI
jgi:two pore calcium channel protein 3